MWQKSEMNKIQNIGEKIKDDLSIMEHNKEMIVSILGMKLKVQIRKYAGEQECAWLWVIQR